MTSRASRGTRRAEVLGHDVPGTDVRVCRGARAVLACSGVTSRVPEHGRVGLAIPGGRNLRRCAALMCTRAPAGLLRMARAAAISATASRRTGPATPPCCPVVQPSRAYPPGAGHVYCFEQSWAARRACAHLSTGAVLGVHVGTERGTVPGLVPEAGAAASVRQVGPRRGETCR